MAKMTKSELSKRKAELKRMVHADIVKREVMQFRLESDNIEKLYGIAVKKRKPVGTLVREWITERINAELGARQDNNELVVAETGAQYTVEAAVLSSLAQIERKEDEILKHLSRLKK